MGQRLSTVSSSTENSIQVGNDALLAIFSRGSNLIYLKLTDQRGVQIHQNPAPHATQTHALAIKAIKHQYIYGEAMNRLVKCRLAARSRNVVSACGYATALNTALSVAFCAAVPVNSDGFGNC